MPRERAPHERDDQRARAHQRARRLLRRRVVRAVAVPVAGRRADGDDGLEELDVSLGLAVDVDGLAGVVGVLLLLDGDDAEDGVGVLVVEGEVGEPVVLVVVQQDVVAVPAR